MSSKRLSFNEVLGSLDCVAYEPETDCKSAFSVDRAFHAFRHQRDLFYQLYDNWKNFQSQTSFSSTHTSSDMKNQLETSVGRLVSLSHDASNMYHLAKLFVSQLIRTCIMGGTRNFLTNDQSDQFLSSIQNDKLKKLRKRLDHAEVEPPSTFNDEESFFYQFIVTIKNQSFYSYLKLMLVQKIEETDRCSPVSGETDEDLIADEKNNIKHQFTTLSLTLQVLAKFLGLVVFLPYQVSNSCSLQFIETQVSLRKDDVSCINFIDLIRKSVELRKISLTIPWILQFLRQMDTVSPRLKCYQDTIKAICKVKENLSSNRFKCDTNTKAYLINIINSFNEDYQNYKYLETGSGIEFSRDVSTINFDEYHGLIDEDYTCNPTVNLSTIITSPSKPLIVTAPSSSSPQKEKNRLTPRKIRPVTLTNNKLNSTVGINSPRQLQFQELIAENGKEIVRELENDFLSLHPMSLVKVIELVSERIYSRCIKELKHSIIYQAKETITDPKLCENGKPCFHRVLTVNSIRAFCSEFAHEFCSLEVPKIIPLLLSVHDYTKDTMTFAARLTVHKTCEKCCQWIISNINPQWLTSFFKNSTISDEKLERKLDISGPFNSVRDLIRKLLIQSGKSFPDLVSKISSLITELTNVRKSNLPERHKKILDTAIHDLTISVIVNSPNHLTRETVNHLLNYWKTFTINLTNFVSPRNVNLLNHCPNINVSWDKYIYLLTEIINCDIYSINAFQIDCLSTLKQIDHERITFFTSSLKTIISDITKKSPKKINLNDLSNYLDELNDIDFPALG
ncbi:codanin-1-like [Panonychus citri]|uniref:codanin-1-like n=1 Tax=Panonychus citri TaxID=50023 RepID=UPI0023072B15|nr:codanin-1-like [Panonychus citri]